MKAIYVALALAVSCNFSFGADGGLDIDGADNLRAVLDKQIGQVVEVRMKSGDKFSGKVASVGDKVLHLSQLAGQEFFDAVIDVKDVTAVIVRVRTK